MYEYNCEKVCSSLFSKGYAYLPSIQNLIESNNTKEEAFAEIKDKTYSLNNKAHLKLMKAMDLERFFGAVFQEATNQLRLKIKLEDRYFVARRVKSGQLSESYRGHFDSHFLTIVLPIKIPVSNVESNGRGELKAVPDARKIPRSELVNLFQKTYWKKFASESGFSDISKKKTVITEFFDDYRPLAFIGTTTFHGNNILLEQYEDRLTFLCHLYDTSPKYGVGALLRRLRNR